MNYEKLQAKGYINIDTVPKSLISQAEWNVIYNLLLMMNDIDAGGTEWNEMNLYNYIDRIRKNNDC